MTTHTTRASLLDATTTHLFSSKAWTGIGIVVVFFAMRQL